jgi:hypothetical protein
MAEGERIHLQELEALRREAAKVPKLEARIGELERQLKEILGKLDEALRAK